MADNEMYDLAGLAVDYAEKLLNSFKIPPVPPELEGMESVRSMTRHILNLREYIAQVSEGSLSQELPSKGFTAGLLKKHVSNLRHMTWQLEQVTGGDLTQRIDFLGEFSDSFNNMITQFATTLRHLEDTKEDLTNLTASLQQEIELRTAAVRALEKSKARFQYLADHDPLTKALNRRSFFTLAVDGIEQARIRGSMCSIAMLDIDHFKNFNDSYGHVSGDAALRHVVKVSTQSLRQRDCMGRFGGEEFIFFFDETNAEIGFKVIERIRTAIAQNPVELESQTVTLTASIGLAIILPEWTGARNDSFLQKIVAMADVALYRAKQAGRNQVSIFEPVHPDNFTICGGTLIENSDDIAAIEIKCASETEFADTVEAKLADTAEIEMGIAEIEMEIAEIEAGKQ